MFKQIKKFSALLLATTLISASLVSCKKDNADDDGDGAGGGTTALNITSKINQDSELSYIKNALGIAGLADTLSKAGTKFTFFAPVNAALDSLGEVIKDTSYYTAGEINEILRYHI